MTFHFAFADLPFLPRPPRYTLYIAQLVLGTICLWISFVKEPLVDRSGQFYFNRRIVRVVLPILGVLALACAIAGFVLDGLIV